MPFDVSSVKKLLNSKYTAIVIIFIVSIGVYLNTLPNEFVYDDRFQVLNNPWIRDIRYIPDIILSNVWAFEGKSVPSNYYRPLLHITYMIDYHIFGLKPWGFHLTNIIFHAGVSLLVFLIASILINQSHGLNSKFQIPNSKFKNPKSKIQNPKSQTSNLKYQILSAPFIAALLFATHPILTEPVACIGGIADPLFTLFYLLSFYFYINSNKIWGKSVILSAIFFLLATLSKETALTLPLLLLAYDYSFRKDTFLPFSSKTLYHLLKRYIPYLIVSIIYFILRTYALGGFAPLKRHAQLSNYEYLINIFPIFTQYLEKLILPINMNAFYVFHPISSIFQWKGIIAFIFTLAFITLVYVFRRHKVVFLCLLWIVIPLLPVLYIPTLGENTFAERYLYLPSIGFVILISTAIERIYSLKIPERSANYAIISILIILTGLYSVGTIKRNYIWRDNYSLWTDTVKKSPDTYISHNNMGRVYYEQQRFEDAVKEYIIAIRLRPDYPESHNNLGDVYLEQENFDNAIKEYMIAIKLRPDSPEPYNNIGTIYTKYGRFEEAIKEYMIAIKLRPDFADPHYNLAIIYSKQGKFDDAIKEYMAAIKQRPDSPEPHNDLGTIYAKYGRFEEAIKEYTMALKLAPDYYEALNNLGNVYSAIGKFDEAIRDYLIALKLNPEDAETHNNIANAYMEKREIDKAVEHYEIALKLNPNYYEVHYNLGFVYLKKGLKLKAEEKFKTALKLRPDFALAKEALKSVK